MAKEYKFELAATPNGYSVTLTIGDKVFQEVHEWTDLGSKQVVGAPLDDQIVAAALGEMTDELYDALMFRGDDFELARAFKSCQELEG